MWGELYRSPGRLHTRTRLSSVPKTNRDSSLNTTFCQSVTFHIDLAWHHSRRSCRCSGVKGSARNGRLDLRFASARCLELLVEQLLRLRLLVSLNESLLGPKVLAISNGTLRTIYLASNTACRPACSFHPDYQASLKLA
ncbi:uncharacterized protein TNCV_3659301 [Trichonephila clavipes]|nr:uncharacterized protein TNCV_3659301 [Trichonephila clavipes]